ncbi:ABC transporter ATP-binding protein [Candidatus Peregrinibacteria bacterium]|nr:ABC transporter ATP-binding protein [Candidatus Peregrinibacteria bacterium]MBI3816091.1 ABC transporter ATP-binding protein [Candidatus Peregrinibacteria bacterium]
MSTSVSHTQVLRFVWRYVRRHLPMLGLMAIFIVLSTIGGLAQPFFYKEAIDTIVNGHAGDSGVAARASMFVTLGILVITVSLVFDQLAHLALARVETHVMARIWSDVFAKAQRLSMSFHVNAFAGATSRKIGRGVDSVEGVLDRIWMNFLPAIALIVGLMVVLFAYAPVIGIAMMIGILLYATMAIALNIFTAWSYTWADAQDTLVSASMVDAITGNALVKSFAAEPREDVRHRTVVGEWQRRQWIAWALSTGVQLLQFLFLLTLELVVLLLAVRLWSQGKFTVGGFIVVTYYVMQLWGRLQEIGRNTREYLKSIAHCEEMVEIAEKPLSVIDRPDARPLNVTAGAVRFDHVRFQYDRQSIPVFADLSIAIKPGEKIALVGHSGGGKSTFVKLLLRLYDVTSGGITIDGQDIASVTQESLRSSIALVPQDPILFHRTIAENIAYGKPDASMEEIEHASRRAHAEEFISVLPLKYETLVGERGVKLSGGERQRVAIARAILANKPILVLDEATSSLDSLSEGYIQDALVHLMEGRTTIVIAHRLSTIKRADRILVIERGQIVEEGSHRELLGREGGIYRQLYELQAGGFIGDEGDSSSFVRPRRTSEDREEAEESDDAVIQDPERGE